MVNNIGGWFVKTKNSGKMETASYRIDKKEEETLWYLFGGGVLSLGKI